MAAPRKLGPQHQPAEMLGRIFGRLTIIELDHVRRAGRANRRYWRCRCACGGITVANGAKLRSGRRTSCGCARRAQGGLCVRFPREYSTWRAMVGRCEDISWANYWKYGGRGIRVCERWHDFKNFLDDMGPRPAGKTLDRRNGNGHYEPNNCRWATPLTQRHNRRDPNGRVETLRA